MAFLGSQASSNDSARNTKSTTIAEALEKYYEKNQEYPSEASLHGQSIATLKTKLDVSTDDTFVLPGGTSGTSSLVGASITPTPTTSRLVYRGAPANATCQTNAATGYCDSFTLSYVAEKDGAIKTIESRNTDTPGPTQNTCLQSTGCLAPPTTPSVVGALSGSNVVFTASAATCPTTGSTLEYKIRHSNSAALPSWSTSTWASDTTAQRARGSDKDFYSQASARCVKDDQTSASVVSAIHYLYTAVKLATPYPYVDNQPTPPNPANTQLVSWEAIPNAYSYTVEQRTNPASSAINSCNVTAGVGSTNCNFQSLSASTLYYYSVVAKAAPSSTAYLDSDPATASRTTGSPCAGPTAPSGVGHTSTTTSIQTSWTASTVASGCGPITYTVSHSSVSSIPACTAITTTACNRTGLTPGTCYTIVITASTPSNGSVNTTSQMCTTESITVTAGTLNDPTVNTSSPTGLVKVQMDIKAAPGSNTYTAVPKKAGNVSNGSSCSVTLSGSGVVNCVLTLSACNVASNIFVTGNNGLSGQDPVAAYSAKPTAPGSVSLTNQTGNNFVANWGIGSSNTSIYQVRKKDQAGTTWSGVDLIDGSTTTTLAGTPGHTYNIRIYASNCSAKVQQDSINTASGLLTPDYVGNTITVD